MSKAAQRRIDVTSTVTGILFGLTCATYLETTTSSDWHTVYAVITSISRICALTGAYLALVGLVLVARIPYIERSVGHDRLVIWHRKLGPWSMYLVSFHVLLVILGYAGNDRVRLGVELWRMIKTYPWMLPAFIAFLFFISAGITSYKKVRKNMTYETWWTIHLYTYLAISLGYMHQVLTGPMFINHPLNKVFWELLYIYAAVLLILWRFVIPNVKSLRHQLRVDQIVQEAPGIYSVIMRGRNLNRLNAQGGQFFGWRFLTKGQWWISHPYSLSAAPTDHYMRVTIKELGDHSSLIKKIKKGTRVFFEGPYGTFTASRASRGHIALIGGGVGITPIRALLEELDIEKEIDVIFRASKPEDILFKRELDELARIRGARVHYLIGSRKEHPMTPKYISKYLPAFKDSDVYVCGPTPLVDAVRQAAQEVGIPKNRFHDEAFEFHNILGKDVVMRKGLLIGIGTLGGLGAVLAITPPQFTNTKLIGGTTPAPQPATPTPTPTPTQTQAAATPAPTKATPKKSKKATTPSNTPTPVATQSTTSSGVSGTFTGGTFQNRFGPVQVQITVENGKITAAKALQYPNGDFRSASISQQAIPYLVQETLQAQSANIQGVGGASYTSYGWYQSLQSALAKAGMK